MAMPWHRIFGMALTQYFAGTAWKVEVEVDLSLQQQRLDIVVLRRGGDAPEPVWPDGFGPPADYNLITFKALQDPLSAWSIKELASHSVNYRKQVSPHPDRLLPEEHFRLLAASMRFPRGLADRVPLQPVGPGAYDVEWGTDVVRVLVLREMPEAEQNLVWNLFSSDQGRIAAAFHRIHTEQESWSSLVNALLKFYGLEGLAMPYTMEDFKRDVAEELLSELPPEKLLARLTPEQLLAGLTPEQRLAGLSKEEIEAYLRRLTAAGDKPSPDPSNPPL